jgi:hypothetical protein
VDEKIINELFASGIKDRRQFFDYVSQAPELTEAEAIAMYESKEWESWPMEALAIYQITQKRLCVPIDKFKEAIGFVLDRPIWSHELAEPDHLIKEYLGNAPKRTFEEIVQLADDLTGNSGKVFIANATPGDGEDYDEHLTRIAEEIVDALTNEDGDNE